MRRPERIPIVLELINWDRFLTEMIGTNEHLPVISENLPRIIKEWYAAPDLRLGQLLINMGLLPDIGRLWMVEEVDWLVINNYCNFEDINFWGRDFNKDGRRIDKTEYILLKDLTDDHIENILRWFVTRGGRLNSDYEKYFIERLKS